MLRTSKHRSRIGTMILLVAVALLAATALTGCGDSDASDAEPSAARTAPNGDVYNDADVTFAQQMIPHHAQAIAMADLTRGRELSPEVAELAASLTEAQTPEIETMTGWLTSWGEEVPETMRDHANAHGDGMADMGEDMPGMMSQDEMDALESTSDAEFEDMWLEMMVEHHNGAIEMAQDEQEAGSFSPAVDLAADIETGQRAEVDQITDLIDD
jgi:uncharacterized protein (DUF305 family)